MRQLMVRPLVPNDLMALTDMFGHLSERSSYLRFFTHGEAGRRAELEYLATVDGHRRVALVAGFGAQIIGIARYHLGDDGVADVAVCVVDGWQHHGVGLRLMRALVAHARTQGLTALRVSMLADNHDAVRLVRRLAPAGRLSLDHGVLEATLPIAA